MTINTSPLRREEKAIFVLRALYEQYGYSQYKMNKFEEYDLYVRNKDFLVSDQVITFTDTDGKLMALKPDVTLSIIKNGTDEEGRVEKVYYDENVYRIARSSGVYREIMQVGLECIGDTDPLCTWEVLTLALKSLSSISSDFVLDVSHMGVIREMIDDFASTPDVRSAMLRALGEKNTHDIAAIPGAERLSRLITCYGSAATVRTTLEELYPAGLTPAAEELISLVTALEEDGYAGRVRIDFSVMSDSKYYSGIVFKGFVNGIPTDILSGGQYDNLMRRMKRSARAIGFAVYLDALEQFGEDDTVSVDTVILYDDATPLSLVRQTVLDRTAAGERITTRRTTDTYLCGASVIDLRKGGSANEANA